MPHHHEDEERRQRQRLAPPSDGRNPTQNPPLTTTTRRQPNSLYTINTRTTTRRREDYDEVILQNTTPNTKFPYKSLPLRQIDTRSIALALKYQHNLMGLSRSHMMRQERVRKLINQFELHTQPNVRTARLLAATLATMYAPATTLATMHMVPSLAPRYRDATLKDTLVALTQDVARTRTHKEFPANITEQLARRLQRVPSDVAILIRLQFVTASRHADLLAARLTHVWHLQGRTAIRMYLPIWKSDRKGKHFVAKTFCWPESQIRQLLQVWRNRPSYARIHQHLLGVCTPHDVRRIAMTVLAKHGSPPQDILTLTGHAEAMKATARFRRYVAPTPLDKQSTTQMKLSEILHDSLRTHH